MKTIIKFILVPALVAWIIFGVVFQVGMVPTNSMHPVAGEGSVTIGLRHSSVCRQDIVCIKTGSAFLIKRVIGLGGDNIQIRDDCVFINGKRLDEPYTLGKTLSKKESFTVPKGYVFIMGDNREHSEDSRAWKNPYMKESSISSKIIKIL